MCVGSPTAFLLWSILSIFFWIAFLSHLWTYDRFQCIKWNSGQPGAFKRLMTYSYLGSLPLLVVFNIGITRIKYKEGYIFNGHDLVPKPCHLWDLESREWLLPLYFCLSFAWALEIATHLEELMFWMFLLHQGPGARPWFQSWEFRMWSIGSAIALVCMPLTTALSRHEPVSNLAWILLIGAMGSTCTTFTFFYVLARFPTFIQHLKGEGVEPAVIVRLITFYQLNQIRVVFRFIYSIPLLIVAADAIQSPYPIVGNLFALDLLLMLAGIGCFVSSGITLAVFFPRSMVDESGYRVQEKTVISPSTSALSPHQYDHHLHQVPSKTGFDTAGGENPVTMRYTHSLPLTTPCSVYSCSMEYPSTGYETRSESRPQSIMSYAITKTRSVPSRNTVSRVGGTGSRAIERRHSDGAKFGAYTDLIQFTRVIGVPPPEPDTDRRVPRPDPYVASFTSPIDLLDKDNNRHSNSARSSTQP